MPPEELVDREEPPIGAGGPDDISRSHLSILGFEGAELSSTVCATQGVQDSTNSLVPATPAAPVDKSLPPKAMPITRAKANSNPTDTVPVTESGPPPARTPPPCSAAIELNNQGLADGLFASSPPRKQTTISTGCVADADVDDAATVDVIESSRKGGQAGLGDMEVDDTVTEPSRKRQGDQDQDSSVKLAKRRRGAAEETRVTKSKPIRPRRSKLAAAEPEQEPVNTAEAASEGNAEEKRTILDTGLSQATFPAVPAQAPAYVKLGLELFVTVGEDNWRWKSLVTKWIELETKARYQAKSGSSGISKQDRPTAVGMWISRGRKRFDPKINLDDHALKFSNWRRTMQPEDREEEKELDDNEQSFKMRYSRDGSWSWEDILIFGPNGAVSILAALAWWIEGVQKFNEKVKAKGIRERQAGSLHEEKLSEALDEVYYVFGV